MSDLAFNAPIPTRRTAQQESTLRYERRGLRCLAVAFIRSRPSPLTPDNESSNGPVSFALIGDMPYSPAQYAQLDGLIADINAGQVGHPGAANHRAVSRGTDR